IVTTNKTDFFREPNHFAFLLDTALVDLVQFGHRNYINAWSAASSTGEEPYTMAMIFEQFRTKNPGVDYSILATDISGEVLRIAKKGTYPAEKIIPIPLEFKKKCLLRHKDRLRNDFRITPELRCKVSFARLNLMANSYNMGRRFEIIFCRNVLIYFERQIQEEIIKKLFLHLVPGGYFFLGHSETLAGMSLGFTSVGPNVYKKPD
ncbi:MAG: protein-glutamate O-methyltransferase CheR, partial [Spirochaetota bacterium]